MSSGWGGIPWGLGPWGLTALSLSGVYAIDTHTVLVILAAPAKAIASYNTGDALNPVTWTITDTVTGQVFTILSVTAVDSSATTFSIHTLESLGPFQDVHLLDASLLQTPSGATISSPTTFTFFGLEETTNADVKVSAKLVDLENTNAYRITSAGDYAEQSGGQIVRKIILRRLTTRPGGFFFLTEFGIGINIKQPVTPNTLLGLKAEIERQVKQEPEVEQVRADLTLDTRGLVFGFLRVRLINGTDTEEIPLVSSAIQF